MHPTVDEQLAGARRLMELVMAESGLSDAAMARLTDAARLVRRVERSWAEVLAFLTADNRATAAVLGELADRLPDELAAAIGAERAAAFEPDEGEVAAAHDRNQRLRALLAEAAPQLDADDRRLVARHLRHRLEHDPTSRRPARSTP